MKLACLVTHPQHLPPAVWLEETWTPRLVMRRARVRRAWPRPARARPPRALHFGVPARSARVARAGRAPGRLNLRSGLGPARPGVAGGEPVPRGAPSWSPVRPCRRGAGFTLIEMLTVIAIIGVLAAILLPVLAGMKDRAKAAAARAEMSSLVGAIHQYETEYNRFPATKAILGDGMPDFTYAGTLPWNQHSQKVWNSVVMEILLDRDRPGGPNQGHQLNPRNLVLFHAKPATGDNPGLSSDDWVLRDPWGTPYIITIDLDGDEKCVDMAYGRDSMQSKDVGLVLNDKDQFELNGSVMIWSFGKDRQASPDEPAKAGVNNDNVLSWR